MFCHISNDLNFSSFEIRWGILRNTFKKVKRHVLDCFSNFDLIFDLCRSVATSFWAPIYKKDVIQIENVQRRATSLVSELTNVSYQTLGLPSLAYRRDRADMIQVYTILNGIDKVDKDSLFTMSNQPTRGHLLKIIKKRYRLSKRTFLQ